jgi:hypothetical protein
MQLIPRKTPNIQNTIMQPKTPLQTISQILQCSAIVASIVTAAHADPASLSDNLKGYSGNDTATSADFLDGSGLEPATIGTTEAVSFDANGAKFGQFIADPSGFNVGWDNRNFLRTTEQAYGTVSFIAYVTVQRDFIPEYGIDGYGAVYFGLGSGEPRFFRTPDGDENGTLTQASTFFRWQSQGYISWNSGVSGQTDQVIPEVGYAPEPVPRKQGTTRLMMAYDANAKTMSYAIDYEYNGTFAADQTAFFSTDALTDEFIGGERSSIYFGSNGEVSFSDFTVQVLPAGPVGPVSFSNNLKGYPGNNSSSALPPFLSGSGLEPSTYGEPPKISFTSDGAVFGTDQTDSWPQRNFLRTTAQDYGTVGFTAYVTARRDFVPDNGVDGTGTIYFGLGSGAARWFRTPDGADGPFLTNSSTFFRWQSQAYISWHAGVKDLSDNSIPELGYAPEPEPRKEGVTRLSMTYDPSAKTIVYGIDYEFNGTFSPDQTSGVIDVTALESEFASGDRSSIFFGSNGGVSFYDFSVSVAGSGTLYEQWAQGAAFESDSNNDGVTNGMAWILGAATPGEVATDHLPNVATEPGFLTLTFNRVADLGSADLWVEFSNDLGLSDPWTAVNVLDGPLGTVVVTDTPGSPLNSMTIKIPTSEASPSGSLFTRLRATQP